MQSCGLLPKKERVKVVFFTAEKCCLSE